jgi:hypothetical protein
MPSCVMYVESCVPEERHSRVNARSRTLRWLFISAHIVQSADHGTPWDPVVYAYYYIPGIVATAALVM